MKRLLGGVQMVHVILLLCSADRGSDYSLHATVADLNLVL
jgi:hypothetical protein